MALTTEARTEIATALRAKGLPAFPYLPATVSLPAAILVPGDPYVIPDRIGATLTYTARFRLSLLAQALDNESGLIACEELIDATMAALPDGVLVVRCGPPLLDDLGAQGSAYVAEMEITAHVTGPAPTPPPPPSQADAELAVDLYGGSYVRMMTDPVLDDLQPHWIKPVLAVAPGPGGAVFADTQALHDAGGAVWFDHGGQLGHVKTNMDADLMATMLARYINEDRTMEVQVDTSTDPAHPILHILTTRLPHTTN